jgi:hypothetical protein
MKSEADRCKQWETFRKIDAAFCNGDLAALRAAVDEPDCVPNGPMPGSVGRYLEYAIYHNMVLGERDLPAIEVLREAGADPRLRTGIDDYGTPREIAETAGVVEIAKLLATYELRLEK